MQKKNINIKIGGHAGEGIKVSGLTLSRCFTRLGYHIFSYSEYPSLVRGGHNTYQIYAGVKKVWSQVRKIDLLIALNQETITLHQDELKDNSIIFYDPGEFELPRGNLIGKYLPIKFIELAKSVGGKPIMANMVSLGAVLGLFGLSIEPLKEMIKDAFEDKGQKIVELNQKGAGAGKEFIDKNYTNDKIKIAEPKEKTERMVLTGNEAVGLGAIAGGMKFYSAYPMTPASSILHYLAGKEKKAGLVVKHTGDEISAINMALGASMAGARAMTATSGGGLCLMAEGVSLSGVSETPLVIVNSQRPGPGLGMPTWTGQGDLQFVLHIGHDEFPRIVLAPGDAKEAFEQTRLALGLAEKFQLPVFVLIDKYISESDFCCKIFKGKLQNKRESIEFEPEGKDNQFYKRYKDSDSGISLRTIPGVRAGLHVCNSYEHGEAGLGTEDANVRIKMMSKRMRKLDTVREEIPELEVYGDKKAKMGVISWGSNKGVILEAIKNMSGVKFLHVNWVWPFAKKQVEEFIKSVDKCYCVECNMQGQFANLIMEQTGLEVEKVLKFDGRPFYPKGIKGVISN